MKLWLWAAMVVTTCALAAFIWLALVLVVTWRER